MEGDSIERVDGLARNTRLVTTIAGELIRAEAKAKRPGKPARRFQDFAWSTLESWSRQRRVVAKAPVGVRAFGATLHPRSPPRKARLL